MNKREYESRLRGLEAQEKDIQRVKAILIKTFKQDCGHAAKYLVVKANHYDDEYGKWMESWTDYTYSCTRCGTELPDTKEESITVKDLRVRLNEVNRK